MKRALILVLLIALLVVGMAVPALAGGKSDVAQTHPGHMGAVNSGTLSGIPTLHFHAEACFPECYPTGPGGWGATVSYVAKMYKGIPNAHGG